MFRDNLYGLARNSIACGKQTWMRHGSMMKLEEIKPPPKNSDSRCNGVG